MGQCLKSVLNVEYLHRHKKHHQQTKLEKTSEMCDFENMFIPNYLVSILFRVWDWLTQH